tara:strand:- start:168 stop:353 length:186 start_codon:yes stop_codon:yes gene_type:complete
MNALQLIIEEIDTKHSFLLQKLGSGTIKDYPEYKYVCGNVSGILAVREYVLTLQERLENDE